MQKALASKECILHYSVMRTHTAIIRDAKAENLHERLGVNLHTVRSWAQRGSIPSEHWKGLVDAGAASLDELAQAAAARKQDAA